MPLNERFVWWYELIKAILVLLALLYAIGTLNAVMRAEPINLSERERIAVLERNVADVERRVGKIEEMSVDVRLDRLERAQEEYLRMQEQQRQLVFGLYVPLIILSLDVVFRFYLNRKSASVRR